MKKIFFVALAATLLAAGCQKTEIINRLGDAMTFSTEMGKLTKADGTPLASNGGEANLKAQDFRVWAYYVAEDANTGARAGAAYDGMVNSPVTYTKASDSWDTDKQYYWPGKDKELKFFAVSADAATYGTGEESKIAPSDDRTKLDITGFTVSNTEPNTDLMVADFVTQSQNTKPDDKSVSLNFRHALTKVEFWFKTGGTAEKPQETKVWVQNITVTGINTVADLNVDDSHNFTWSNRTTPLPFSDKYVTGDTDEALPTDLVKIEGQVDDNSAMQLTHTAKTFATWLVIPQDVKKAAAEGVTAVDLQVEVLYVMGNRQFKASFPLGKEGDLDEWKENQYVKYNVTLTPNLISFVPSVSPWTPTGEDAALGTEDDAHKDMNDGN